MIEALPEAFRRVAWRATRLTTATPERDGDGGRGAWAARSGPATWSRSTASSGRGRPASCRDWSRGLGVTTPATSPTFVLVNEYRGRLPVHHVDAYRTGSLTELMDLGLLDLFGGDGVTLSSGRTSRAAAARARDPRAHRRGWATSRAR